MNYADLFDEELIVMEEDFSSQAEMFGVISDKLHEKDYVKNSFKEAIIQREKDYPTGLETETMKIAIPHTDVVHVKRPFIYVAKLKKSLPFVHMGTSDSLVNVDNIFMLGIKDPSKQVGLLSLVMEKLQDEKFKDDYHVISNKQEMITYLKKIFRGDV